MFGAPRMTHQMPLLHSETQRNHKDFSSGVPSNAVLVLRGPVAILFIQRDTFSDSIAKLFRACFCGVSHNDRVICCKMGYRTDMSV